MDTNKKTSENKKHKNNSQKKNWLIFVFKLMITMINPQKTKMSRRKSKRRMKGL